MAKTLDKKDFSQNKGISQGVLNMKKEKEVKGIFWKSAIWYFDKTEDFMAAFPGFKLWIEVERGLEND